MINRVVLVVLVACCGASLAAEPLADRWQALNPALAPEMVQEPYDTTYPEAKEVVEEAVTEDEPVDFEYDYAELPFKLPFKLDKKQVSVAMKLLKAAVKPILKNKALRETLAYVDEALTTYDSDIETQLYVRLVLDSAQDIYEGKEIPQLNAMVKGLFTDGTNQAQARTIDDMWDSYVSPFLSNWFYSPLRRYLVSPLRDNIYTPMSNAFSEIAERVGQFMGMESHEVRYDNYPYYNRWGDSANNFVKRMSSLARQARQGFEVAAMVVESQDANEARACGSNCQDAKPSQTVQ